MYLSELAKIINALPPVDATAGKDAVYVNVKNYTHVTVIVQSGVGNPSTVTVEKDADGSGAGTAIAFNYRLSTAAYDATNGDKLVSPAVAAGVGGIAFGATDNYFMVIELDTDVVGAAYPYVRVCLSGASNIAAVIYILSGQRYSGAVVETALTV